MDGWSWSEGDERAMGSTERRPRSQRGSELVLSSTLAGNLSLVSLRTTRILARAPEVIPY